MAREAQEQYPHSQVRWQPPRDPSRPGEAAEQAWVRRRGQCVQGALPWRAARGKGPAPQVRGERRGVQALRGGDQSAHPPAAPEHCPGCRGLHDEGRQCSVPAVRAPGGRQPPGPLRQEHGHQQEVVPSREQGSEVVHGSDGGARLHAQAQGPAPRREARQHPPLLRPEDAQARRLWAVPHVRELSDRRLGERHDQGLHPDGRRRRDDGDDGHVPLHGPRDLRGVAQIWRQGRCVLCGALYVVHLHG
mmetsp:Transcript_21758/g.53617  ORF Transcript_21758/g.53617 Transcript_21758/m.53617 type:complete len:247 (-) Transcript_21758:275-1015(-)